MTFRTFALLLLILPALAVSYYFAIALPIHNKAMLEIEQRKYYDQKHKEMEASDAARLNAEELRVCINQANALYDIGLNGNRKPDGSGGYKISVAVANSLRLEKEADVAECHRKYGK